MLKQNGKITFWAIALSLIFLVTACSDAEPVVELETTVENAPTQAVSTATPDATTNPVAAAAAPTATDLPTEIIEPISPISPVPTAEESVAGSIVESMDSIPGSEEPLAAALDDLSQQTGVPADQISLVSIEARQWSDSSLGCPQEGFMYAQVITPGYLIVLDVAGTQYNYHTDQASTVILCEE
ncbi:MAG: hypothetical protein KDJ65_07095 [Anaerolineae bacterium]|nr:hypothetical protein [Anaerolineae bacterium]